MKFEWYIFSFYKNAPMKMSSAKCVPFCLGLSVLTHWGRVMHICIDNLNIIASDNGLSSGRRQATIRTNAVILLIGPLETNFSLILIEIHIFYFKKMHFKASGKWRPFCLGLSLLKTFLPLTDGSMKLYFVLMVWQSSCHLAVCPQTWSVRLPW